MGYSHFRYARKVDADKIKLIHNDGTELLILDKGTATVTKVYGGTTAGDDLYIIANSSDVASYIEMMGGGDINFNAAKYKFREASSDKIFIDAGSLQIGTYSDNDLYFNLGTGVMKFGTHTALGGEALSGYITIKDAGGTTRKLGVIS